MLPFQSAPARLSAAAEFRKQILCLQWPSHNAQFIFWGRVCWHLCSPSNLHEVCRSLWLDQNLSGPDVLWQLHCRVPSPTLLPALNLWSVYPGGHHLSYFSSLPRCLPWVLKYAFSQWCAFPALIPNLLLHFELPHSLLILSGLQRHWHPAPSTPALPSTRQRAKRKNEVCRHRGPACWNAFRLFPHLNRVNLPFESQETWNNPLQYLKLLFMP